MPFIHFLLANLTNYRLLTKAGRVLTMSFDPRVFQFVLWNINQICYSQK